MHSFEGGMWELMWCLWDNVYSQAMIQIPFSTSLTFSSPFTHPFSVPESLAGIRRKCISLEGLCVALHKFNISNKYNTEKWLHFFINLIWGFWSLRCKWQFNSGPLSQLSPFSHDDCMDFRKFHIKIKNNTLKPKAKGTGKASVGSTI